MTKLWKLSFWAHCRMLVRWSTIKTDFCPAVSSFNRTLRTKLFRFTFVIFDCWSQFFLLLFYASKNCELKILQDDEDNLSLVSSFEISATDSCHPITHRVMSHHWWQRIESCQKWITILPLLIPRQKCNPVGKFIHIE